MASTKAKEMRVETKSSPFKVGFLAIPEIKLLNKRPRPHPGPAKEIHANPAPINF